MNRDTLPYRDHRVDEMIEDPSAYFASASARAYTQARRIVEADLAWLAHNAYPEPRSVEDGAVQ